MMDDRRDFIHALPKAEMHLHIEGAVPWKTIQARDGTWGPSVLPPWWAAGYRFESFTHFSDILRRCYERALTCVEDYGAVAQDVFKALAAQNVRYVELSFSLGHALSRKLSLMEVVDAMKSAAPASVIVRVFCGVSRSRPPLQENVARAVLSIPALDGLDLHGDETAQSPAIFADLFARARRRGLATKAHAGELAGPDSMREIIDTLHVARIEHGVQAIHDEALMERLIAEGITLDLCPTSNIKLRVVDGIADYPIRAFHRRGIKITVSTDNPTILGCDLSGELNLLVKHFRFSLHDLAQVQRNAFEAGLIDGPERGRLLTELDEVLAVYAEED